LNIHKIFRWDNHISKVMQKAHNTFSFSEAEILAVAQQTSKPNAIPHL
jgi:hypothetical protein